MISRYTRPEMGSLWEPQNRFQKWLDVEIAACEAWHELGAIPAEALDVIKRKAAFRIERIDEIEREVKHDVIAFLTSVAEHVGPESRFVHMGLTSSDVVDTALSLLMREAADRIIAGLRDLMAVLKDQAYAYKHTPCIGRSHGVHAEPMTFGLKFALWHAEAERNLKRMQRARAAINVGTISGAVGTFSNLPPKPEEIVCTKLGLAPEPLATQVIQRDRHAEYMTALALLAGLIEKIAIEMRHLQRTEVREAEEPFTAGQKGSSAMPHKRNPVGYENLSGLARIVRSNAIAAMENMPLWHERDISHSSVERVIIPDSTILVDYMLHRMRGMLKDMHVYPERMLENMELSCGLYNSQRVLLALVQSGKSREDAYLMVQRNAMESWRTRKPFLELLRADAEVVAAIGEDALKNIFQLDHYLQHVDYLFERVFGA